MCRAGSTAARLKPGDPAGVRRCARVACPAGSPGFSATARGGAAFTLIEMVVVIVLIAVLSGMALSSLAGSTAAAELRTAARQLHLAAQGARSHAALHAVTTRLTLDPAEGRFLVEQESAETPGTFEPLRDGVHKAVTLPDGVKFGYFDVEPLISAPGKTAIRFNPAGDATAAVIEITDTRRSFTLRVDAATGRVVLTEGLVTERLSERVDLDA